MNYDAETIDIRAAINLRVAVRRQLAPLFGRHVIRSAEHLTGDCQVCASSLLGTGHFAQLRNAKVE